jgi:hypothetical protein
MDPYIRHWQASTHADVECVKCHDYGAPDLVLNAFKQATGSYNARPKANVLDENCLASDCHDLESLSGDIEYRNNIKFEHAVHFGEELRGEKLRCTSCHNQIVQYEDEDQGHMAVNDKSCFVCHFKNAGRGEAITGCDACHGMPEQKVEHAGFEFDHGPYLELGVECKQCHTGIVEGDGAVGEEKCHSCHIEESPREHSRQEIHDIHVTVSGIDCYRCHSDIEHGSFEMVGALDIQCENCHLRQHNQPKQLYMGIGGKNGGDHPSSMFRAQVSCVGCHTHLTPEGEKLAHQEKKEASRASCVACHGEGYDLMLDNWLDGAKKTLADYRAFMNQARTDYKNAEGARKARAEVRRALSEVDFNYNFVREGHIPHNIQYAVSLLNTAADRFESSMKQIDKTYQAPDRGSALNKDENCTVFCHSKMAPAEFVQHEDSELPHQMHFEDMELKCNTCHSTEEHGKTIINQSACADCH